MKDAAREHPQADWDWDEWGLQPHPQRKPLPTSTLTKQDQQALRRRLLVVTERFLRRCHREGLVDLATLPTTPELRAIVEAERRGLSAPEDGK